ncbi:fimbrial assembly protein [Cellulomonas dongxiuzhuiae]|uniref:Fimbrial assembly protein n=1 Tax=Cellulomonas dongxiuzhuiae TaxID=2819979 RepID=A0ABX8GF65_9CELL|nr:fimbrial assembly protein [Cellulomonas dongxiuzhuiae]MBO3087202.1 fimbrial assembly protein [Cellulomonas dongxiuzhuiae]MBO3090127.1 fimbrial assembly protein [Cellulomonas dongxiuzhuiae]MBO3093401.1 fimbrial assembly protein [Cellulomonas dongxiuzhuiae]QWC14545.1 fimbrial assembly protein [Cellulomonas dongxiuzhuiae]
MNAALAPTAPTGVDGSTAVRVRVPQVNLLPSSVSDARGLRTVKRWALLGVAATVLLVALVYVASALQLAEAQGDLTAAQARTTQLQGQMAEYSEVPLVLGELGQAEQARSLATSTEVLWRPYLDSVRAALPADAALRTLQVTGATPTVSALTPADPLQPQAYGQIAFTAASTTIPDSAAWVDALRAIPGFVDPRIQSVVAEATETTSGFLVTGTVQYDANALSGRFQESEGNE